MFLDKILTNYILNHKKEHKITSGINVKFFSRKRDFKLVIYAYIKPVMDTQAYIRRQMANQPTKCTELLLLMILHIKKNAKPCVIDYVVTLLHLC